MLPASLANSLRGAIATGSNIRSRFYSCDLLSGVCIDLVHNFLKVYLKWPLSLKMLRYNIVFLLSRLV